MKIGTRWRLVTWLGTLALSIMLVGCGATTTARTADAPSPTTAPPTATPAPTSVPTASASQLAACDMTGTTDVWQVGDLLVTVGFTNITDPSRRLPDGTPLAPFHLAAPSEDTLDAQLPPDPAVNPNMTTGAGGYWLSLCNSSPSQTHVIKSVSVRMDSVAPYSGKLNAWNICNGGTYDASTKQVAEGCGGGFCANETLKATFDSATAGANAIVTQVEWNSGDCAGPVGGPLPVSLKPHSRVTINVGIALPSSQATYTLAFGVAQDSPAAVFLPATQPILLAPVAQKWTGEACLQPAMQSQIPSASSPTFYICPAS